MMCSYVAGDCMPPFQWPETFNSSYDCSIFGYEESARKLKEMGREEVELHRISITFTCTILSETQT
tara:strand:+ start:499 stop:696 length:198 start_codon:yes stop_codon:yes gene_type:complete